MTGSVARINVGIRFRIWVSMARVTFVVARDRIGVTVKFSTGLQLVGSKANRAVPDLGTSPRVCCMRAWIYMTSLYFDYDLQ